METLQNILEGRFIFKDTVSFTSIVSLNVTFTDSQSFVFLI